MSERLPSRNYAAEFSDGHPDEIQAQLAELKEVFEVLSPTELAIATIHFIRESRSILHKNLYFSPYRTSYHHDDVRQQFIALGLAASRDCAIEQGAAAFCLEDRTAYEDFVTVYEAANFEYRVLTDPQFHPVTVPVSCDEIYDIAKK